MDFSYLDDWVEEDTTEEIQIAGDGYRNIWVVAEIAGDALLPATLETMGQARELADQIGVYVFGLLLGAEPGAHVQTLIAYGADKVLIAGDGNLADYLPGLYVQVLGDLVEEYRPEILLMPATPLGNDLAPRLAQHLNTGLISHCVKLGIDMSERLLLGTVAVMGGEMYNTIACPQARPQMATLEPGHFPQPYEDTYRSGDVENLTVDLGEVDGRLSLLETNVTPPAMDLPLGQAKIVVAAGRGMTDADGFALVQALAGRLGGAVAGSRGAFDEGWIDEDQIVGVGGQSIAPDLYIACGLAGDVYHYFGAHDAKFVVAINPDENAPITKIANVALVGDAKQILPAMLQALPK
ncbi:MAG: electron transfer flavoprotein subunit alpha/FixB family protein [Anaerolineae bacterium]|jgi:electron transfer flavoprotein alpha subunit